MANPAGLKNSVCSGHGCFPPRGTSGSGSSNVKVNGQDAWRVGDGWSTHCCGPPCHSGVQSSGSGTVMVNGKAFARVGDAIDCGSVMAVGSPNVMVG